MIFQSLAFSVVPFVAVNFSGINSGVAQQRLNGSGISPVLTQVSLYRAPIKTVPLVSISRSICDLENPY